MQYEFEEIWILRRWKKIKVFNWWLYTKIEIIRAIKFFQKTWTNN